MTERSKRRSDGTGGGFSLDRRALIKSAAILPLAQVLASKALAQAAASGLQDVEIELPGGGKAAGVLALPAERPAPAVLMIHEWWGLNDQIKAMAAEYAKEGFVVLAADLFDGRVATTPEEARGLVQGIDAERATETLTGWIDWLRDHEETTGAVGTVGWCFGGGWSLNASIAAPVDATVIYYGNVEKSVSELSDLDGPVLGHFAEQDGFIDREMVDAFAAKLEEINHPAEIYWYDADHAFANPTGARYDEEAAATAHARTLDFLDEYLWEAFEAFFEAEEGFDP